jgi:hypothetical protein
LGCWLPATLTKVHVSVGSGGGGGGGGGGTSRSAVRCLVEAVAERLPRLDQLSVDFDGASIPAATRCAFEQLSLERWTALNISRCSWCEDRLDAVAAPDLTDAALKCLVIHLPRLRSLAVLVRTQLSPAALQRVGRACRDLENRSLDGTFSIYDVAPPMRLSASNDGGWAYATGKGNVTNVAGSCRGNSLLFPNFVGMFITAAEQPSTPTTDRYVYLSTLNIEASKRVIVFGFAANSMPRWTHWGSSSDELDQSAMAEVLFAA